MKKLVTVFAAGFILTLGFGCATKEYVDSRYSPLEERIGKLEKAAASAPSVESQIKKADDAAMRAEAAAKKAEEAEAKAGQAQTKAEQAEAKAEAAEKAAMDSEKKAETAAQKSGKHFELMQKK